MTKPTPLTADQDSLVALDALLRIRDSVEHGNSCGVSMSEKEQREVPSSRTKLVSSNKRQLKSAPFFLSSDDATPHPTAKFQPVPISPASLLLSPITSSHYCNQMMAAQARWGPSLPTASLSTSHNGILRTSSSTDVPDPLAKSVVTNLPVLTQKKPVEGDVSSSGVTAIPPSSQSSNSGGKGSPVRSEKVEAALRSKPQRGRRRDDLSDKERLELTRTRNREHAKSTRIRKKARYEELLDREEQWKRQQRYEEEKKQQKATFQKFLSIRQDMLRDRVSRRSPDVSSQQPISSEGETASTTSRGHPFHFGASLSEVLAVPMQDFRFDVTGLGGDEFCRGHSTGGFLSMAAALDDALIGLHIASQHHHHRNGGASFDSTSGRSLVYYKIVDGLDSIALSKGSSSGFAHVDLVLRNEVGPPGSKNTANERTIQSAILVLGYAAPTSSKLVSAKWHVIQQPPIESFCDQVDAPTVVAASAAIRPVAVAFDSTARMPPRAGEEHLGNQLVHPSVVSLDKTTPAGTELEDSNGKVGPQFGAEGFQLKM